MRWRTSTSSLHLALAALPLFSLCTSAAVVTVEGNSPNVSFTPADQWRLTGSAHIAETPGAVVTLLFTGTAIQMIGAQGRAGATFGVSIDEGPFEAGTSNNGDDKVENVQLFVKQNLNEGVVHTLAMVHAGQRGQAVDVDRFLVLQPDVPVPVAAVAASSNPTSASLAAPTEQAASSTTETPPSAETDPNSTKPPSSTASVILIPSISFPSVSTDLSSSEVVLNLLSNASTPPSTASSSIPDANQFAADTAPGKTEEDSTTFIVLIAAGSGIAILFIASSILLCYCLRRRRLNREQATALEIGCAGEAFAPVSEAERLPVRWVEFEPNRESLQWPARARQSEMSMEGYRGIGH